LAQLFNDQFWKTKFFDYHQRSFVLTYEFQNIFLKTLPLEEPDPLKESNLLEKSNPLQEFIIESLQDKKS